MFLSMHFHKKHVYWQNSSIGCDQIVCRRVPNYVPVYKYDTTSITIPGRYFFCGRISYKKGMTAGIFKYLSNKQTTLRWC